MIFISNIHIYSFHSLHFLAEISHILHIPFIKILNQLLLSLAPLCAYSGTYTIPEFYFFTCNIPYFKSFFTYLVYFCLILYIVDTMFLQVWIMIPIKYIGIFFLRQFIPEESALPSWGLILDFLKFLNNPYFIFKWFVKKKFSIGKNNIIERTLHPNIRTHTHPLPHGQQWPLQCPWRKR